MRFGGNNMELAPQMKNKAAMGKFEIWESTKILNEFWWSRVCCRSAALFYFNLCLWPLPAAVGDCRAIYDVHSLNQQLYLRGNRGRQLQPAVGKGLLRGGAGAQLANRLAGGKILTLKWKNAKMNFGGFFSSFELPQTQTETPKKTRARSIKISRWSVESIISRWALWGFETWIQSAGTRIRRWTTFGRLKTSIYNNRYIKTTDRYCSNF